jgi:hypothetical protein
MRSYQYIVAVVALAISACDSPGPGSGARPGPGALPGPGARPGAPALARPGTPPIIAAPGCPTQDSTCVEVRDELTVEQACPSDRWIGYLAGSDGTCDFPRPELGWHGTSLFEPVAASPHWDMARGLAPFCVYRWTGSAPPGPAAVDALHSVLAGTVQSLGRDCRLVVPAASESVEQSWEQLHEHVHEHVGFLDPLPLDPTRPPRQIRVALIDSVPSNYQPGSSNTGESPHGWAVGSLIRELTCPAPLDPASACVSFLSPHLALPLDATGELDPAQGGFYGRVSDIAVAVADAVNDWRLHNVGLASGALAYQTRLMLNLSVAWELPWQPGGGPAPGPGGNALEPAPRAVFAALTHLKCWGGVAIAAAGNDPGGTPPVSGPMLPAAWETEPAPDATACAGFEAPSYPAGLAFPAFPPAGTYDPLVHAVGAVRADDRPIASTRPGGRPRLAALGAHVVAADREGDGLIPTAVQTGSSMAAAVVSGSAAAAWSYYPGLSGAALMVEVYRAGEFIDQTADFCLGGSPCPDPFLLPRSRIRRVEVCRSIEAVCDAGGPRCPTALPECTDRGAGEGVLPIPSAAARQAITVAAIAEAGVHSATKYERSLPALPVCGHDGFQSDILRYPQSTCPFRQWGLQPAPQTQTSPQPGSNPCPACWMEVSAASSKSIGGDEPAHRASVFISIETDYPYAVTGATLDIPGYREIDLPVGTLEPGDEAKVIDIPIDAPGPFDTATINFRHAEMEIDGTYTPTDSASSNELIVYGN